MKKEKFKLYLKEYIKLAKRAGIVFLLLQFSSSDNYFRDNIYLRLKTLHLMLDTFFHVKIKKKQIVFIGLKSVIGYNPDLVASMHMELFDIIELESFSLKEMITEKECDNIVNIMTMYSNNKTVESRFSFEYKTREHVVAKLVDKTLEPLSEHNSNIAFDFFQTQPWVSSFIPIFHKENFDHAILNLIRIDFAEKSLITDKGNIQRFDIEENKYIDVITIDQYMNKLPALLFNLKNRFCFQLYYFNYHSLLAIHAKEIRSYFEVKYLLPNKSETTIIYP